MSNRNDEEQVAKIVDTLRGQASEISEKKLYNVAKGVNDDLRAYALAHKRTGKLYRNITIKQQKGLNYVVDGGERKNYSKTGKSYNAITFFITEPGRQALTKTLQKARKSIK